MFFFFPHSYIFSLQVAGKRDPEQEVEAQQWIEAVTGEKFPAGKYFKYFSDKRTP